MQLTFTFYYYNYDNKMNSKNKFVYLGKLTKSINPIHHKLINEIFLSDSIATIYNELLPSLPIDVLKNLYINIKNNLYLFTPEQIEKLKPIVTFYTNIKFPCSTQCNPIKNPGRLPLQDKEYGTKKECLSKCPKNVSITNVTDENLILSMSFLSFEDKLQYLIGINRKELISKIQERDIYNPDIIIKESSPVEKEFRPYVIIVFKSKFEKNKEEYKKVKYIYSIGLNSEEGEYDVIYEAYNNKETIINIRYSNGYKHADINLVLNGKPLTKKETIELQTLNLGKFNKSLNIILSDLPKLKELYLSYFNQLLGNSLSKLIRLEKLKIASYDHPLGHSLSKLTQLKSLDLASYNHPLGDSLSKLAQLKELDLVSYNHPLGDSLSKLTQLEFLSLDEHSESPLGDSLSKLTQLKELNLEFYNHLLGNSLSNLTQLKILNLESYNHLLGDSLSNLTQLRELRLYNYKHLLGDSLLKLTQLERLDLNHYKHPLGNSLSKLTQLKELYLEFYNHPLGNSLSKLTQLEKLSLESYTHSLGDSLSNLTQLKILNLDSYNNPLGDSLTNLTKLKELNLVSYNHLLGDSLSNLTQLRELKIDGTLKKRDGKPIFSFTRKNPVNKKYKEELREMNFDQLKQRIKDLRREGYKISVLSKLEDKDRNRKLLRKIIRDTEKG
jgi:hypothetical protein